MGFHTLYGSIISDALLVLVHFHVMNKYEGSATQLQSGDSEKQTHIQEVGGD